MKVTWQERCMCSIIRFGCRVVLECFFWTSIWRGYECHTHTHKWFACLILDGFSLASTHLTTWRGYELSLACNRLIIRHDSHTHLCVCVWHMTHRLIYACVRDIWHDSSISSASLIRVWESHFIFRIHISISFSSSCLHPYKTEKEQITWIHQELKSPRHISKKICYSILVEAITLSVVNYSFWLQRFENVYVPIALGITSYKIRLIWVSLPPTPFIH